MKELLILVQAHNEENQIRHCLFALDGLLIPKDFAVEKWVVLDRCTDKTKNIAESLSAKTLEKDFQGEYNSPQADNIAYSLHKIGFGKYVLVCDADIQEIPNHAFLVLHNYLKGNVKRVSSEVKTRSGKWWLDFLFWLRQINYRFTPMGESPRGAFCLFERQTVEEVGGFDKGSISWDTAFDLKIKRKGWGVYKAKEVIVTEKRDFTLMQLIRHQILEGKARRQLKTGLRRTLLHSIFRCRVFVLIGYLIGGRKK